MPPEAVLGRFCQVGKDFIHWCLWERHSLGEWQKEWKPADIHCPLEATGKPFHMRCMIVHYLPPPLLKSIPACRVVISWLM